MASSWITDSCAVVRIMLGCDMDKFILGVIIGMLACCVIFAVAEASDNKRAVESGWIKIDGEFYTLRKADVVEVKSQN